MTSIQKGWTQWAAAFGRLCVETPSSANRQAHPAQPPSGGCVLKQFCWGRPPVEKVQPPSGGCVLKHAGADRKAGPPVAAAFGRLCVETIAPKKEPAPCLAAAFGRLCVETHAGPPQWCWCAAAAFGRLCVETTRCSWAWGRRRQPPSGGCVLKRLPGRPPRCR